MSESTKLIRPLPTNDIIVAAMNAKTDSAAMNAKTDSSSRVATIPVIPLEVRDDAAIISGTREKRAATLKLTRQNLERDIPIQ